MKKLLSITLIVVMVLTVFTACNEGSKSKKVEEAQIAKSDVEGKKEVGKEKDKTNDEIAQVLKLTTGEDCTTLDPNLATDSYSFHVIGNTNEGLFRLAADESVEKAICESYVMAEDGKEYTFKLRRDAIWTNGEPVTAHDFEYSWKRLANPQTGAEYTFFLGSAGIKNAHKVVSGELDVDELGVRAIDDYTLVVTLDMPIPYFESLICFQSFLPLNEKFVESMGEKHGTTPETTLSNGPFKVTNWQTEYSLTLTKNDQYFDKEVVKLDQIIWRVVKDSNTRVNMYEIGEIDEAELTGEMMDQYAQHPHLEVVPRLAVMYFHLNYTDEIFQNINARKAVALAFDKSFITEEILKNGSTVADYLIPYGLSYDKDGKDFRDTSKRFNTYDVKSAKEYWEKAKEELALDSYEIEFLVGDNDTSSRVSEYVQAQLQSNLEGLRVNIQALPGKARRAREKEGNFSMSTGGWGPDYADSMTFLDMWLTGTDFNVISYTNDLYDTLINRSKSGDLATQLEDRFKALQEAERILIEEECALVPYFQEGKKVLKRNTVHNLARHAFGPAIYREVYITEQ